MKRRNNKVNRRMLFMKKIKICDESEFKAYKNKKIF